MRGLVVGEQWWRGVRGLRRWRTSAYRTPWPFQSKKYALQTQGPLYRESWDWPLATGNQSEFSELSQFIRTYKEHNGWTTGHSHPDYPELQNLERVQYPGYTDPVTRRFVFVPEMHAQIVAPDLTDFKLKPYVSYKVEDEIEREKKKEDGVWPAPQTTPELLFHHNYETRVRRAFKDSKYDDPNFSAVKKESQSSE